MLQDISQTSRLTYRPETFIGQLAFCRPLRGSQPLVYKTLKDYERQPVTSPPAARILLARCKTIKVLHPRTSGLSTHTRTKEYWRIVTENMPVRFLRSTSFPYLSYKPIITNKLYFVKLYFLILFTMLILLCIAHKIILLHLMTLS